MARTKSNIDRVRLNFQVSEELGKMLENVKSSTGAESFTEVFRRALKLYAFVASEQAEGNKIIVQRKNGSIELKLM